MSDVTVRGFIFLVQDRNLIYIPKPCCHKHARLRIKKKKFVTNREKIKPLKIERISVFVWMTNDVSHLSL